MYIYIYIYIYNRLHAMPPSESNYPAREGREGSFESPENESSRAPVRRIG